MIKVIFFDFDGTISDSRKIAYLSMVKVLDENGYEFDEKKLLELMGSKMQVILKDLNLKTKDLEIVRKKFYKYFIEATINNRAKPCVSLKLLWKLSKDYPLIVVSNSETSFLKTSIKKLKLKGLFKEIYGAEKFTKKDKMLKELFKKFRIKPHEAIYIGDENLDFLVAIKSKEELIGDIVALLQYHRLILL